MSWNREQVSALIELFRSKEVLYVVKDPQYHNKSARIKALEEIAANVQEIRPNSTANDVKIKINSLRTQFNKQLNKLKNAPSGCGAELVAISLWCFEDLLFLQDHVVARGNYTNLPVQPGSSSWDDRFEIEESQSPLTEDCDATNEDGSSSPTPAHQQTSRAPPPLRCQTVATPSTIRKKKADSDLAVPIFEKIGTALQKISTEEQPCDVFGQFISTEIQSIKNNKLQKKCKRSIIRTILQYQEEDEDME